MIFYIFLNVIQVCCGFGFWWTETTTISTTTTTTTENPLDSYFMNEEFYFEDKILRHQLILPGTKYCGPGNKSNDYNDLGRFKNVDLCCRNHDSCPDNIPAGKYKHGLYNNAKYTKSHCECDEIFHNCLKILNTPPARIVGALYFSVFHINCYRKDYPIVECLRRRHRRCLEYKLNLTATPVYQWFDNPFFKHWIEQFPTEDFMNITSELNITINTNVSSTYEELEPIKLNNSILTMIDQLNSTADTAGNNSTYYGYLFYTLYTNLVGYLYNLTSTFTSSTNHVKLVLDNSTDIIIPVMNSSFDEINIS